MHRRLLKMAGSYITDDENREVFEILRYFSVFCETGCLAVNALWEEILARQKYVWFYDFALCDFIRPRKPEPVLHSMHA